MSPAFSSLLLGVLGSRCSDYCGHFIVYKNKSAAVRQIALLEDRMCRYELDERSRTDAHCVSALQVSGRWLLLVSPLSAHGQICAWEYTGDALGTWQRAWSRLLAHIQITCTPPHIQIMATCILVGDSSPERPILSFCQDRICELVSVSHHRVELLRKNSFFSGAPERFKIISY